MYAATTSVNSGMYWWTNIAVPETENTRVIVPTRDSIHCLYQSDHYVLGKEAIPYVDGVDVSYPLNLQGSSDYFYKIDENHDKWEAAVDKNGYGFLEYSDRKLIGRKLFLWGKNPGGRHWNEWLSEKGQTYIEIQAGLAHTQLEHIPMPAKTAWEWTEAFTAIDGNATALYGEWDGAISCVEEQFAKKVASGAILSCQDLEKISVTGEAKTAYFASGWGDLENKLRARFGQEGISKNLHFTSVCNETTADWYELLESGCLPQHDAQYVPTSYVTGELWEKVLAESLQNEQGKHWFAYLQYGVCSYANGKLEQAMRAWESSIEKAPSIWVYRNLAMAYTNELSDSKTGLAYMEKALQMQGAKENIFFLKDYATMATNCGADKAWIEVYNSLHDNLKAHKRLQVYLALAYLHIGDYKKTMEIITPDFVLNDIKEGELSMSKIWTDMYIAKLQAEEGMDFAKVKKIAEEKYPLPYALDFRMHELKKEK